MLVIHPKEQTTAILSILYSAQATHVIETDCSDNQMGHLLHHTSNRNRSCYWDMAQTKDSFTAKMKLHSETHHNFWHPWTMNTPFYQLSIIGTSSVYNPSHICSPTNLL